MKVRVRQSIGGEKEKVAIMEKNEAIAAQLKYQFHLLLEGIYMKELNGDDQRFKLVRNGSVIGYFYIENI